MGDPFQADQVLDITIGDRVDNKVYRAHVASANRRHIALHVPGFDPLHFIDLLKGTAVSIRMRSANTIVCGQSTMAKHFKNSSPFVVIRRPEAMEPVRRTGIALVHKNLDIEYCPNDAALLKRRDDETSAPFGRLELHSIPEPFDIGTVLVLSIPGENGTQVSLNVKVVRTSSDPDDPSLYSMVVDMVELDGAQKDRLLRALLGSEASREEA